MFPDLKVEDAVNWLSRNGFALGVQLPRTIVEKIKAIVQEGAQFKGAHLLSSEVHRIAHDTRILDVVEEYLGATPILYDSTLFWTLPSHTFVADKTYAETFHYDVGDVKSLCVCFYLTDVGEDCAPHVAIAGTHRHKSFRQLLRPFITDEFAYGEFGTRITKIMGKAGTGFFEDQLTQHKRAPCSTPRLALFIEYTLYRKPQPASPDTPASQISDKRRRPLSTELLKTR